MWLRPACALAASVSGTAWPWTRAMAGAGAAAAAAVPGAAVTAASATAGPARASVRETSFGVGEVLGEDKDGLTVGRAARARLPPGHLPAAGDAGQRQRRDDAGAVQGTMPVSGPSHAGRWGTSTMPDRAG